MFICPKIKVTKQTFNRKRLRTHHEYLSIVVALTTSLGLIVVGLSAYRGFEATKFQHRVILKLLYLRSIETNNTSKVAFMTDIIDTSEADGGTALPQLTPDTFINRELATIEFQRRVLAQAKDPNVPLLERIKFLAIVGNNLDEFFMVRAASYIQKLQMGINRTRPDGHTPLQLLQQIRAEVDDLFKEQRYIKRDVFKLLKAENIHILRMKDVSDAQREVLKQYFTEVVFPVLTPLAVDHARPFPFI